MEISTERTIIRNFIPKDFNDLFEYLSLPETYLYEPGEPINMEQAKEITLERSQGNSFFAVVCKPENKLIGHFSFFQIEPKFVNTYEIGYIFNPKYQGKGFALRRYRKMTRVCLAKVVHFARLGSISIIPNLARAKLVQACCCHSLKAIQSILD